MLPEVAAWRHVEAREGFEVVRFSATGGRLLAEGCTTAVEEGEAFVVAYAIEVDAATWTTRSARIGGRSALGPITLELDHDGAGSWLVDGAAAPALDGLLDVDLESSVLTNAFPARRLALTQDEAAEAPAVYVRALDLQVERLEQTYRRTAERTYDYASPAYAFRCDLVYDAAGLLVDYPGIAVRAL